MHHNDRRSLNWITDMATNRLTRETDKSRRRSRLSACWIGFNSARSDALSKSLFFLRAACTFQESGDYVLAPKWLLFPARTPSLSVCTTIQPGSNVTGLGIVCCHHGELSLSHCLHCSSQGGRVGVLGVQAWRMDRCKRDGNHGKTTARTHAHLTCCLDMADGGDSATLGPPLVTPLFSFTFFFLLTFTLPSPEPAGNHTEILIL
jgi:hypothetical protein